MSNQQKPEGFQFETAPNRQAHEFVARSLKRDASGVRAVAESDGERTRLAAVRQFSSPTPNVPDES